MRGDGERSPEIEGLLAVEHVVVREVDRYPLHRNALVARVLDADRAGVVRIDGADEDKARLRYSWNNSCT